MESNLNSCTIDMIMPMPWWLRKSADQYWHSQNIKTKLKFHRIKSVTFSIFSNFRNILLLAKKPKSFVRIFYTLSWPQELDENLVCSNGEPSPSEPRQVDSAKMELAWTSTNSQVELVDDEEFQGAEADSWVLPLDSSLYVELPAGRNYHPGDVFAAVLSYQHSPGTSDEESAPYLFSFK